MTTPVPDPVEAQIDREVHRFLLALKRFWAASPSSTQETAALETIIETVRVLRNS